MQEKTRLISFFAVMANKLTFIYNDICFYSRKCYNICTYFLSKEETPKMKRLISLILALVFIFSISACGNKKTSPKTETNAPTKSETFTKPEKYASVLLISINPQFKLYLDENNNVVALEPVNDDAKSFCNNIDHKDKSIETVIGSIIEEANKNGFMKEDVTVDFEITEQQGDISNSDILSKAASIVQQKALDLKIVIDTQIKENDKSEVSESPSEKAEETENQETQKHETTTKPENTTDAKDTTSKTDTPSAPTASTPDNTTPTHTHSFSAATCTEPQKCSCGETTGTPTGHNWQEATCKTPKTCSVCQATDGNIGDHKYANGTCVYCDKKEIINPKTGLKERGNYYFVYKDYEGYDTLLICQFHDSLLDVVGYYDTNEFWKDYGETITYKGKTYYDVDAAGGPTPQYTLTDTEIIVKYVEDDPDLASSEDRLIVNSEYNLEVIYSTDNGFFEEGAILELVE